MELKPHPLAACFPMLSESELQELADDIKINGLRHKIVLFENLILDGRNRYAACQVVGFPVENSTVGLDPIGYVISANLKRRHLDTGQRAAIASELANAKVGGRHSPNSVNEKTVVGIAREMQVSPTSVTTARAIAKENPEIFEQIKVGKIGLNRGAKLAGVIKKKGSKEGLRTGASAPEADTSNKKPSQDYLPEGPWWKNLLPQELDEKQERRLKNDLENSIEEFMAGVERFIAGWEPHGDQAIDLLEEEFTRWVDTKKPGTDSKIAPAQATNEQKETKEEESASEVVSESSAAMEPENTPPSHEANPDMAAESIGASGYTKEEPVSTAASDQPAENSKRVEPGQPVATETIEMETPAGQGTASERPATTPIMGAKTVRELTREKLERAFSKSGNPRGHNVDDILNALEAKNWDIRKRQENCR